MVVFLNGDVGGCGERVGVWEWEWWCGCPVCGCVWGKGWGVGVGGVVGLSCMWVAVGKGLVWNFEWRNHVLCVGLGP